MSAAGFTVSVNSASAGQIHAMDLPENVGREAWVFEVDRPALVLGSSQDSAIVDHDECAARGIEVVSRRSGGGIVLVESGAQAWIDVLIPAGDPLWEDDLSHAFDWLGAMWQRALAGLGIAADIHQGRLLTGEWGKLICFAGRGPGELFVAEAKAVGMSLRRTRHGARFQTMALATWRPEMLVPLLSEGIADPSTLLEALDSAAVGLDVASADLSGAFLAELQSLA